MQSTRGKHEQVNGSMNMRLKEQTRKALESAVDMLSRCYTGEIEEPYNNDEIRDLGIKIERLIDELNQ